MSQLKNCEAINEVILLSTCNRVEIIMSVREVQSALNYSFELLSYVSDSHVLRKLAFKFTGKTLGA